MAGHPDVEELVAAYVLHSLAEGEEREVARQLLDHLSACQSCGRLYQELRETTADLALAAPAVPVPPVLHERVMTAVRPSAGGAPDASRRRRRLVPGSRLGGALAAAGVAAVLGLGGLSVSLGDRLSEARLAGRQGDRALASLSRPGTTITPMSAEGGVGRVSLASVPDGRTLLLGTELRLPEERVFEVWLARGDRLIPVATFVPRDGRVVVELPFDASPGDGVAITVERRRVERPTTTPVFRAALPA